MNEKLKQKIQNSFDQQGLLTSIGAKITSLKEGELKVSCPYSNKMTQQNGYFHAAIITSIVDVACGYAANTVMPLEADVLTVEYKVNFLRSTKAAQIIATGMVIKSGKRLVVCEGQVIDSDNRIIAKMIATLIPIFRE